MENDNIPESTMITLAKLRLGLNDYQLSQLLYVGWGRIQAVEDRRAKLTDVGHQRLLQLLNGQRLSKKKGG